MATQQSPAKRTEGLEADAVPPPQRLFDFCEQKTETHKHMLLFVCVYLCDDCNKVSVFILFPFLEIGLISFLRRNKSLTWFLNSKLCIVLHHCNSMKDFKQISMQLRKWWDVITLDIGYLGKRGPADILLPSSNPHKNLP